MQDEHLKDYLSRSSGGTRGGAESAPAPSLPESSGEYRAYGRASADPLYSLHFILGADGLRSFQYSHLDSDTRLTFDRNGQTIGLKFAHSTVTIVRLHGRNLRLLYDYIHQHKCPWVEQLEAGRDFDAGDDPVVTAIVIKEEKEEEKEQQQLGNHRAKVLEIG
jgi:hypothetical protein